MCYTLSFSQLAGNSLLLGTGRATVQRVSLNLSELLGKQLNCACPTLSQSGQAPKATPGKFCLQQGSESLWQGSNRLLRAHTIPVAFAPAVT